MSSHTHLPSGWRVLSRGSRSGALLRRSSRRNTRVTRHQLITVGCLLAMLSMTGCVYRSLTIRTEPPGSLVYVNDQLKGESPLTYDFVWYGWHRVTLRKNGFQRLDDQKLLRAPVYLWIPFDFVMELVPFRIHDVRAWSYTLTPSPTPSTPAPPPVTTPAETPPAEEGSTTTTNGATP